jgi:glutamate/tyrosine decarboxylase-like PLP-dependent enzyme
MPDTNEIKDQFQLEMDAEQFRNVGHRLVDQIADFLEQLPTKKVTTAKDPAAINSMLENFVLAEEGAAAGDLLDKAGQALFDHSLFNGHPRFWGYITSSAAPLGALADMLAASVNPNVGAYILSPVATMIERQAIQWIAEMIGYNTNCGGLFVSGGNMANFCGFVTGRQVKTKSAAASALPATGLQLAYCARGTHTWIDKAADLFSNGPGAVRWIDTQPDGRMNCVLLEQQILKDLQNNDQPFLVVANAGSVGSGVVDELSVVAAICKKYGLWFHVDGAYGAPAALLPELNPMFEGLALADSVALDPHKWLYSPLEAGCILVKESHHLRNTFSHNADYYNFNAQGVDEVVNFHEYGMQNSRGFRALKVWLMLQQAGKNGYKEMIRNDISLAGYLYTLAAGNERLEAISQNLSITVFRYTPVEKDTDEKYLNKLNETLLNALQKNGDVFVSNAVINGKYCLRACFVNFRSRKSDVEFLIDTVLKEGGKIHSLLQSHV